jgi:hypothetical protein
MKRNKGLGRGLDALLGGETIPTAASTGTLPRIRLLPKSVQFIAGPSKPWPFQPGRVQNRFSGDSTTRSHFTAPRFTPAMCVP